jgi:hypothetical protein
MVVQHGPVLDADCFRAARRPGGEHEVGQVVTSQPLVDLVRLWAHPRVINNQPRSRYAGESVVVAAVGEDRSRACLLY